MYGNPLYVTLHSPTIRGTLNEALDNSETGVDVQAGEGALVRAGDVIVIGTEYLAVVSVTDDTITVTRGYLGTSAATHADDDPWQLVYGLASANQVLVTAPNDGYEVLVLQISGTFVGTLTFEGTLDGTNWIAIQGTNLNAGSAASTATAAGMFRFTVTGLHRFRARLSAYTSGSPTVVAQLVG